MKVSISLAYTKKTPQAVRLLYAPFFILTILLFSSGALCAQSPFITTWKTDNPGTSNSTSITIPTTGGGYNYEVDWNNDGTYPANIGTWFTSNVANMYALFNDATSFNQSVNDWNTYGVTNMNSLFENATSFNQSIGAWHLRQGVIIDLIFYGSGIDCVNYSNTLIGWGTPLSSTDVFLAASGLQYGSSAVMARTILTDYLSWFIDGDEFTTNCTSALSVELLTFTGKQQGSSIALTWRTASEYHNRGWDIERSADGRQWQSIGFRAGSGITSEEQAYTFTDAKPFPVRTTTA